MNTVSERIKSFIVKHFPPARNTGDEDRLLGNGLVDSLGILEVVAFLEREFGITVTDDELVPENFCAISKLAAFVQSKLNPG